MMVRPGCVPGDVSTCGVYLYVSGGGTHLCCALCALLARVACRRIRMGVVLVCAVCNALLDARICTFVANVCCCRC